MRHLFDIINMYFINAPFFLRWYFPKVTWNKSRLEKKVYLTFDDGPIPELTPYVLDTLAQYGVKGTFFCVGENIARYPEIYQRILQEGHAVGNHTHNHLCGWDTDDETYLANVEQCAALSHSRLFRPPYIRAKKSQLRELRKTYEIVLYDVLSGDFDTKLSPEGCYKNVIRYSKPGSIIVFHDNLKAQPRLEYALPRSIAYLQEKGFAFGTL